MTLLDDLKREAQQIKGADSQNQEGLRREVIYEDRFRQPMLSILHYLAELTEQLKILDYEVRHDYTLPGIGLVPGLRHDGYVVNADSSEKPKALRLRFRCIADNENEYAVTPKPKADDVRTFLDTQIMPYSEWPIRDHEQRIIGLGFLLRTEVRVSIVFQADLEIGSIKLYFSNFKGFKLEKSMVQPEMVNDTWLDNLGNYILRNRADLYDLEIDESHKIAIRKKLEEDARRRDEELQQAIERELALGEEGNRRSILGRLKSITQRLERYQP